MTVFVRPGRCGPATRPGETEGTRRLRSCSHLVRLVVFVVVGQILLLPKVLPEVLSPSPQHHQCEQAPCPSPQPVCGPQTTNARRLLGSASFQAASTASTGCAILASTVAADDARGRAIDRLVATYQQSACGNGTSVQVAALSVMSFFDPPSMRFVRRRVDSSRFDNSTGLCSKLIPSYSSLLGRQMALFKDFLTSPPASPLIRSTLMSLHVIHCSHVVSELY